MAGLITAFEVNFSARNQNFEIVHSNFPFFSRYDAFKIQLFTKWQNYDLDQLESIFRRQI